MPALDAPLALSPTSSAGPALAQAPLALSRGAGTTLAEQLAQQLAERIRQRLLAPGARLPSVREAARRQGVSPATVVAAYDQLLAQGLVEARRQRGFFVRGAQGGAGPGAAVPVAGSVAAGGPGAGGSAPLDAAGLIRSMFHGRNDLPAPGLGTLPADWLDLPLLQAAVRKVLAQGDAALSYGHPSGDPRLREALAVKMAECGVRANPAQIVTANGATHALDIIARALLQPGDAVLVDDPGWTVEFARLTQLGMRLLPVPRGLDGPDLAVMATLAREHRPKLYVTVSVLHNPTGNSLSLGAAHQVLKLAEAHDFRVVEDDTYAHLAPAHLPRLTALDGLQRTLYVSGFAKILTPNWRVGYLAAPPALVDRLVDVKMLGGLTTPSLLEQAVAHCLEQGSLRRHAERVVQRLDAARPRAVRLAEAHGCRFVTPPAGLFGWVDTGEDTERLALRLHDAGWLTAPGHLFHATRRASTLMRINFATSQEARFWAAFDGARG
ncbi:aminotransferase-like domain-containing protein [Ideonella livida]|uniref:PLP-dependent aminotransferase family protein n=1 Tax=Ideonella livida TaxID=2707176 RepID=A0A7C9TJW9_9BURK|nr:PLP-dependent aminotransferase family protein [Ideonella livida]NDY92399.1 PLP-dependent aminotransferase family protein [Ideonella livida]